jgi:Tfp pilus assembly protein PilF
METGDIQNGISCFEKCVEADPGSPYGYINLAFYLISFGRPDEAEAPLEKAISLGNKSAAYLNRSSVPHSRKPA